MRRLRVFAAWALTVAVVGCAATTIYSIRVDVLSFIPEQEWTRTWTAADAIADHAILLPYFDQLTNDVATVDSEFAEGVEYTFDVPDNPAAGDLSLTFQVETIVANNGGGTIDGVEVRLFLAEAGTANVYLDEYNVLSFSQSLIAPGDRATISGRRTITRGDPGYEVLRTGAIQIGAEGLFNTDAGVELTYELIDIQIEISIRPFSLLP